MPQGTDLPHGASPKAGEFPSSSNFCYVTGNHRPFVGQNLASSAKCETASPDARSLPPRPAPQKNHAQRLLMPMANAKPAACMNPATADHPATWHRLAPSEGLAQVRQKAKGKRQKAKSEHSQHSARRDGRGHPHQHSGKVSTHHEVASHLANRHKKSPSFDGLFAFQVE